MGLFGIFGNKKEKDTTLAANDTERWIVGTYAMWSEWTEGDWHYFAGAKEKSKQEGASMRLMLRRDWEISDKSALLDMVKQLTFLFDTGLVGEEDGEEGFKASGAWDLCRACQILGMGFVGGYLEREEMIQRSVEIGRIMQENYHSWTELYDNYVKGYKEWRSEQGGDVEKEIAEREELCYRLRNQPDGPCSVAWDLELRS